MIEQHVPTLATCQRLKEAGFPQETEFLWYANGEDMRLTNHPGIEIGLVHHPDYECAAPILTEILEQLPKTIRMPHQPSRNGLLRLEPRSFYDHRRYDDGIQASNKGWIIGYENVRVGLEPDPPVNPVEAAALLYLELKRKGGLYVH